MADIQISVPDGYRILEETETVDIFLAHRWLTTKKQHRYTSAARKGDLAILKKSTILCPHCENRIPAYARFANPCFETFYPPSNRLSRDAVSAWATPQYSFCPQERDTLVFNRVYTPDNRTYTCPHCGRESREYRADLQVTVSSRRGKVILSCMTHDLGDLLRLPWGSKKGSRARFPLEERVVFNFKTGKCWISLSSADGALLAIRNIYDHEDWQGSLLFRLLEENRRVRKLVTSHFRRRWEEEFPFGAGELKPNLLVLLCRHMGFPRAFYARTPFKAGSHFAARSFRATARKMHTPDALQQMLRHSSLPQLKSIRRRIFQSPEHGFYLPELEFLYGCIGNPDLFLLLFDRPFTFELLAFLHQYPYSPDTDSGPGVFFRDYAAVRSPRSLVTKLECRMGEVRLYAVHYSCLPPAARKREQKTWGREGIHCCPAFPHSVPMRASRIPDTTVNGYHFVLLKTLDDCHRAGRELHNCLTEWDICANPVFAVKKREQHLAAIEVRDDTRVLQAYTDRNMPMFLSPEIYSAYLKWMELFGLTEEAEEDPEDARPARPKIMPLLESAVF